jgi:hypothetical protein
VASLAPTPPVADAPRKSPPPLSLPLPREDTAAPFGATVARRSPPPPLQTESGRASALQTPSGRASANASPVPAVAATSAASAAAPAAAVPAAVRSPSSPAAADGDVRGDWKQLRHDDGRLFYYNRATKKTTWAAAGTPFADAAPAAAAAVASPAVSDVAALPQHGEKRDGWKAVKDDKSGKMYFVNAATKKTTWNVSDTPFASPATSVAASPIMSPTAADGDVRGDWQRKTQADTGRAYYYNRATKKTTWSVNETPFAEGQAAVASPAVSDVAALPQHGEKRDGWKAVKDDKSGKMYFVNAATKKTTWNVGDTPFASPAASPAASPKAADGDVRGDWQRKTQADTGRAYYYNRATKKTTWAAVGTPFE